MAIQSYRDFDCYQNALKAIPPTLNAIGRFPQHQGFVLANQIREAAHSVTSNIAEGYGRKDNERDFKHFLRVAMGSSNEVVARLESALVSEYIDSKTYDDLASQWTVVGKQLNKLIQNWKTYPPKP